MISARVICDSISEQDIRLTTFEIEVPRIVWSEFMTHRMFSRNASSSRAIPFSKMVDNLDGIPVRFGKNISGMQDGGEHDALINDMYTPEEWWDLAKLSAKNFSQGYADAGYHKQISGRLTETFQCIKAVVSATEFSNFFWLRKHGAADPTIEALAQVMWEAYNESVPRLLKAGWYHLPYVASLPDKFTGRPMFYTVDNDGVLLEWLTIDEAIKVSCARCCAVSFRNTDYGLEKSLEVYERLVGDERKHGSATEHCASPMPHNVSLETEGVTALHKDLGYMSGNFSGWLQHRQFVKGHTYYG